MNEDAGRLAPGLGGDSYAFCDALATPTLGGCAAAAAGDGREHRCSTGDRCTDGRAGHSAEASTGGTGAGERGEPTGRFEPSAHGAGDVAVGFAGARAYDDRARMAGHIAPGGRGRVPVRDVHRRVADAGAALARVCCRGEGRTGDDAAAGVARRAAVVCLRGRRRAHADLAGDAGVCGEHGVLWGDPRGAAAGGSGATVAEGEAGTMYAVQLRPCRN